MNDDSTYINGYLNDILQDYMNNLDEYLFVAKIIAGIGLLISAYFAFFNMMDGSNNEAISKFLRKFLLSYLGIFYYTTFIGVINIPLNAISEVTRNVSLKDMRLAAGVSEAQGNTTIIGSPENDPEVKAEVARLIKEASGSANGSPQEEGSIIDGVLSSLVEVGNSVANAITMVITRMLITISELALIILNVIRGFYLIVLSIFGIFVITLSTFPTLEGSFSQWLMKYINVYMWLPIGFILQGILGKIELMNQLQPLKEYDAGSNTFSILISLCTIIGFLTIPSISSWMVNASTNALSNKMEDKGKQTGQQVSKAVKSSATGGASAAIPSV